MNQRKVHKWLRRLKVRRALKELKLSDSYLSNQPNWCTKFCFTISFISCLYMFRVPCAHHQEVKIVLYSLWHHHTETSEWSKITKIQFYKYEDIVVKYVWFFQVWLLCITCYKHIMLCRCYVYPVIKLIKKVLCLFTFMFAESI